MSSQTDFNSLDDTLAGRLAQAGIAGVSLALPDYIHSRLGRFLANAVIVSVGVGLVAYFNSTDEDPNNDPAILVDRIRQGIGDIGQEAGPDSDTSLREAGSPLKTWLIILGALLAAVAVSRLEASGRRWLVRKLAQRGVKRPNTILGGVGAVLTFAFSEYLHRQHRAGLKAARS